MLVVDDNATNRRIVTTHLGNWGLPARATESPREALRWIQAGERFDVAILDMHMPEMDGVALARAIRQEPAGAALPLVLFTSLGRREARAEDEGFAAYLHKPIKPSQLFDALASDPGRPAGSRSGARRRRGASSIRRWPAATRSGSSWPRTTWSTRRWRSGSSVSSATGPTWPPTGSRPSTPSGRQTYDVVLMDVQMPELDGFEASREINRRWSRDQRPRIVAMTANAMQGDRELCVAAGMDDYVAKPIRVEELVAALERSPGARLLPRAGGPPSRARATAWRLCGPPSRRAATRPSPTPSTGRRSTASRRPWAGHSSPSCSTRSSRTPAT